MMLRPADWVVVIGACALVGALAVLTWRPAGPAQWLEVHSPSGTQRVVLDQDATITVAGRIGESVIEVAGGRARFVTAPCRNRVCIATGWLAGGDDFAACVPNGISLRLAVDGLRYDSINH